MLSLVSLNLLAFTSYVLIGVAVDVAVLRDSSNVVAACLTIGLLGLIVLVAAIARHQMLREATGNAPHACCSPTANALEALPGLRKCTRHKSK